MATHQFQTEVNQLLKLIIHSMYSNKDIFLREIVSNASDALDKLKYLTVSDDAYKGITFTPRIDITFDDKANVLCVQDSGIGMNEEDLNNNLGTIARSGTKAFMEKLTEEDYDEFIRNIRPVRERLINGYYGRTAIQKAIELVRR